MLPFKGQITNDAGTRGIIHVACPWSSNDQYTYCGMTNMVISSSSLSDDLHTYSMTSMVISDDFL